MYLRGVSYTLINVNITQFQEPRGATSENFRSRGGVTPLKLSFTNNNAKQYTYRGVMPHSSLSPPRRCPRYLSISREKKLPGEGTGLRIPFAGGYPSLPTALFPPLLITLSDFYIFKMCVSVF